MKWRKSNEVAMEDEDPYWKSFVDIMSALLVLFILASVVLILQLMEKSKEFDQEVAQLQQAEKVRQTILDEAVDKLQKRGIKVVVSENHTVLRIPNELLGFETNAFEIQPRYYETAKEIGAVIDEVINVDNRKTYLDTVFLEGHTDNRPSPGYMGTGNWGLSAFRAISLWQLWNTALPDSQRLGRLTNQDGEPLFSVSGYADTRPVSKQQQGEDDYRLNRRIDIRFTIRRPERAEYEAVKTLLERSEK